MSVPSVLLRDLIRWMVFFIDAVDRYTDFLDVVEIPEQDTDRKIRTIDV